VAAAARRPLTAARREGAVAPIRAPERLFVTGATGYIGGRLVPRLLADGYRVRCLARSGRKLRERGWARSAAVEVVEGDVADPTLLTAAMDGCSAAYYLVHSMMAAGTSYAARDLELAEGFGRAAAAAGVARIVYLGGLGETGSGLSEHLSSRRDVERALAACSVPVTVFRAAMIIGSGSASFEILRYLVERLPLMVTPRWVVTPCQPIAVSNVLAYLCGCLEVPASSGRTLDIGGPDVVTYRELMQIMAEALGLRRRLIVPVPVLTPRLSSLWIHLVTPLSKEIARPLAEGLRNPVVCRNDEAHRLMPQRLLSVRDAITAALASAPVETSWSDAGAIPGDPDWAGGTCFEDRRETVVRADSERVFTAVCSVGGRHGWFAVDWLWRLRGFLDRLAGGPGLRRGRRDSRHVAYGDALDFWRVTGIEPDGGLTLRAEMRLPGEAELVFSVAPLEREPHATRLVQVARFKPRGLAGLLYWYAIKPLHAVVFRGMLAGIRREAEQPRGVDSVADSQGGSQAADGDAAVNHRAGRV
jgi:uncharacterized protein YbjT (DUF2867 family)